MEEIKSKIQKVFEKPLTTSLATIAPDGKPWVRYMMGMMDKDSLKIRLATFTGSRKTTHIEQNPEVHIACGMLDPMNPTDYLQIQGKATISTSKEDRETIWSNQMARYFKGPDDPNYTIIVVEPYRIELFEPGSFTPKIWEK